MRTLLCDKSVKSAQGYIDTPTETSKFFQLNSTDGSRLLIDDKLVSNTINRYL